MATNKVVREVEAAKYEDRDDCLTAAVEDVAAELGLEAWELEAVYADQATRETIIVRSTAR